MSERILNKKLSKASGVILIRGGEIIDFFPQTTVVEDRETGRSRGFAFVEMSSKEDEVAIAELNGKDFVNRNLVDNLVIQNKKRGVRAVKKSSFDKVTDPNQEAELHVVFADFTTQAQAHYQKIETSQKEIEKLNTKSAKRQKRFEVAMQKLDRLLK